jgi:hypothetical protein
LDKYVDLVYCGPQTLQRLSKFTSGLRQEKRHGDADGTNDGNTNVAPHAAESYHGQLFNYSDDEDDAQDKDNNDDMPVAKKKGEGASLDEGKEDVAAWHLGKLKFRRHIDDNLRAGVKVGGDGRYLDDYVIIDTRKTPASHRK